MQESKRQTQEMQRCSKQRGCEEKQLQMQRRGSQTGHSQARCHCTSPRVRATYEWYSGSTWLW